MMRIVEKAKDHETMTVSKDEDPAFFFAAIRQYFNTPDTTETLRLEALGSAIENLVLAVHLVVAGGLADIQKIKTKEQAIAYQNKCGGTISEKGTLHMKYELKRSVMFFRLQEHQIQVETTSFQGRGKRYNPISEDNYASFAKPQPTRRSYTKPMNE